MHYRKRPQSASVANNFAKAGWLDFLLQTPIQKGLEGVENPLVVVDDVVTTGQTNLIV